MIKPYDIVEALEERVAEYAGSEYAVAVDSCTNAILLALKYYFLSTGIYSTLLQAKPVVILPAYTYAGVAYSVINAGGICIFDELYEWQGEYRLAGTNVVDSARRFRRGMYLSGTLRCLSCHWGKHLKIGRGGFILTDDSEAARILKIMRFDGRTAGVAPADDNFIYPGHHCYMLPEEAARGLMLINYMPDDNPDLPWDDYPDLRKYKIFQKGF